MPINYPTGVKMMNYHRPKLRHRRYRKYRNHKMHYDGHTFDSKVEFDYYLLLKAEHKTFTVHQRFEILPHYDKHGIKCRKRNYTPDFVLYHGNIENHKPYAVVDIKGIKQIPSYDSMRFSLFERRYHVPVIIVRHTRHGWTKERKMF